MLVQTDSWVSEGLVVVVGLAVVEIVNTQYLLYMTANNAVDCWMEHERVQAIHWHLMSDGENRSLIYSRRIVLQCFPRQIDHGCGHRGSSSGEGEELEVLTGRQISFEAVSLVVVEWAPVE